MSPTFSDRLEKALWDLTKEYSKTHSYSSPKYYIALLFKARLAISSSNRNGKFSKVIQLSLKGYLQSRISITGHTGHLLIIRRRQMQKVSISLFFNLFQTCSPIFKVKLTKVNGYPGCDGFLVFGQLAGYESLMRDCQFLLF